MKPSISIIIPTLNEESGIAQLLTYLQKLDSTAEIIVVDGGSTDHTRKIAQQFTTCIESNRGRGLQLNEGARYSSGHILWFVHADCLPPSNAVRTIIESLESPEVVGGAFEYTFSDERWFYKFIAKQSNRKNRLLKRVYGDMGIFIKREIFEEMNGFREGYLMEDFEFSRRLRKKGQIRILPDKIETSARQWQAQGILKKMMRDCMTKIAYQLGIDNKILYNSYYKGKHDLLK